MSWTQGYVAEIDYTHGYYGELSPTLIDFALLLRGIAPPDRNGPITYLELGFGQGLSTNIHAAAVKGSFWGTDMIPAHAANARTLSKAADNNVNFFDQSFEEFGARDDLPEFDYITMHGIWSWVSDEARETICQILRSRLKVGGVLFISYNTLPGWAAIMPVRHLLTLYADHGVGDGQGIMGRVGAALDFAKTVVDSNARFFTANPSATARLESIASQNRQYVIHEYFNKHWAPTYYSEVEAKLSEAKVTYAGSATVLEHLDGINLTSEQQAILAQLGTGVMRESLRDYMVNQQFRRDLYVRGARRLSDVEQLERLKGLAFVVTASRSAFPSRIMTALGDLQLKPEVYEPLADALHANAMVPKTISELASLPGLNEFGFGTLLEAITLLVGSGCAHPVQAGSDDTQINETSARLGNFIIEQSRLSSDLQSLPSPITGSGISVGRFEQLFLLERSKGSAEPDDWARGAWRVLEAQSQRIIRDGVIIEAPEDNLHELTRQAHVFSTERLPILVNLRVVKA